MTFAAGWTFQRLTADAGSLSRVNSPRRLTHLRFSTPLWSRNCRAAMAFRRVSERATFFGGRTPAANVADLTFSTGRVAGGFDLVAGLRNLFDSRIFDAVGPEQVVDAFPQARRAAFIRLTWSQGR